MNPIAHIDHPRQAGRPRIATGAWDDFEPAARRRRAPVSVAAPHTKARRPHAHLTYAETPALYLREEMS